MIKKTTESYYLCAGPRAWGLEVGVSKKLASHVFGIMNDNLIIWPKKLSPDNCNPKNIHTIKTLVQNRNIVIMDRIKSEKTKVNICGHVNRSGENYLIGMTPYDKYPQFPDMTYMYKTYPHKAAKIVHTVGPKRFKEAALNSKIIWSEAVGLVAPVFHYIGYNIKGIGLNRVDLAKQFLL
ncbi:MAG TPA: hypothetical protein EYO50_03635 [Candidatus Marinimicrobia bacterium]|jgi:hypothetical protein|nr:hypothetical protein [Candidatus Neomarinimicrobiota bacterium]HIM26757.1 hypothetical protein [Candidatus Neomarinimicrobiota bacterium]|tara:strand:- start:464 stop:1003 length:540 start_codon:yes stop_codon:yes gene_type:complete